MLTTRWFKRVFVVFILYADYTDVYADLWSVSGALGQLAEFNDNINMSINTTPVYGYLIKPDIVASWNDKNVGVNIRGLADIRRYDDERWNCDNFSVSAGASYRIQRHAFSIPVRYAQDCSYSEQESDTGLFIPENISERYSLTPGWSWQLSRTDSLRMSLSYSATSFSSTTTALNGQSTASFRDNESIGFNLSEQHNWTQHLSTTLGVFFSHSSFENENNSSSQNVFGFNGSIGYTINRFWRINVGGGLQWVQQPSTDVTGQSSDELELNDNVNISINYEDRDATFFISFARNVRPSSFGQVREFVSLNSRFSYVVTREITVNLNGSAQQNKTIGQSVFESNQDRLFFSASTSINWNFTRNWQMSASYRYRAQEFSGGGLGGAGSEPLRESNAVSLNIKYQWDGLDISQ